MVRTRTLSARLRLPVVLFAAVALLGACGSDGDDDAADDTTTTQADDTTTTTEEEETTTTTEGDDGEDDELAVDVCELFDPADLEDVTGLPFEDQESTATSCTYLSSTGAAIAANVADVRDAPQAGYDGAAATCEDGTREDVTITEADAAFSCIVQGIPTVTALGGDGFLVILTGDDEDEAVDDATITQALIQILENAITAAA